MPTHLYKFVRKDNLTQGDQLGFYKHLKISVILNSTTSRLNPTSYITFTLLLIV